ncbi:MAG: hypothetical protein VKJ46_07885 [Leptolyngbyaceae bacterium]|nr:hypothetical protein [Leptolyngbyaceae bacterium]
MATLMNLQYRRTTPEENQLYDHLLQRVESESPSRMIERFRLLFVDGVGYPDPHIPLALDQVAASKDADQAFNFILNRCCHIVINRWQTRSQFHPAIAELMSVFEERPTRPVNDFNRRRAVKRIRDLVAQFVHSEQFHTLNRLSQVLNESNDTVDNLGSRPLGTMIRRYPYLYQHCLLSEDSTFEHQQVIQKIQTEVQQQFEIDLSQYVTYQVRRTQLSRLEASSTVLRTLQPVKNPTLLNDGELSTALKHFVGRVERAGTYKDVAQQFQAHLAKPSSFAAFKDDFYQYITTSIEPGYGRHKFNNQLHLQLKNIYPDQDSQKINDLLIVRTCSQVLNFLVIDSPQNPQHFVFLDLVNNMGVIRTTGLILKVVLFCRKVKPYLEKRFSILFNHYESCSREGVVWLIQTLENMNVAMSTNFGAVDLSFIR